MVVAGSTRKSNWLCLDCGKDTSGPVDYYMLRNRLWRQLVPREQRHGMLCLACVSVRLGRALQPDDFINGNGAATNSDPAEQPMDLEDYGIIDSLTPEMLQGIDQGLIAGVTSSRDTRVARLIGVFMMRHPAAVPGLPDYFYLMRVERMLDSGVLRVSGDAENLVQCDVRLA